MSSTAPRIYNRPLNHVAVSVTDCKAVVDWYANVLGFQLIGQTIHHIVRSQNPEAAIFRIYPESLQEVKIAYMSTGNGVGFEVFEFIDPKTYHPNEKFEYQRSGFFHICVTDSEPEKLAAKVVEAGGTRIGETVNPVAGVDCLYVADPWGNIVEFLDVNFERMATLSGPGVR